MCSLNDTKTTNHSVGTITKSKKINRGSYATIYEAYDPQFVYKVYCGTDSGKGIGNIVDIDILSRFRHPSLTIGGKISVDGCQLAKTTFPGRVYLSLYRAICSLGDRDNISLKNAIADNPIAILHQIASGLLWLHTHNYLHLDLKPNNMLLFSESEFPIVTITDFGSAMRIDHYDDTIKLPFNVGTNQYLPPENIKDKILTPITVSIKTDVWAFGISCLEIIQNTRVIGKDIKLCLNQIDNGVIKDLLAKTLEPDPSKRIDMKDVLRHPLFTGMAIIPGKIKPVNINTMKNEKYFPIVPRLISYLYQYISRFAIPHDIRNKSIRTLFLAIDLIYRSLNLLDTVQQHALCIASLAFALRYHHQQNSDIFDLSRFITIDELPINEDILADAERKIVLNCNGMVYREHIYEKIKSEEELHRVLSHIVLDPSKYYGYESENGNNSDSVSRNFSISKYYLSNIQSILVPTIIFNPSMNNESKDQTYDTKCMSLHKSSKSMVSQSIAITSAKTVIIKDNYINMILGIPFGEINTSKKLTSNVWNGEIQGRCEIEICDEYKVSYTYTLIPGETGKSYRNGPYTLINTIRNEIVAYGDFRKGILASYHRRNECLLKIDIPSISDKVIYAIYRVSVDNDGYINAIVDTNSIITLKNGIINSIKESSLAYIGRNYFPKYNMTLHFVPCLETTCSKLTNLYMLSITDNTKSVPENKNQNNVTHTMCYEYRWYIDISFIPLREDMTTDDVWLDMPFEKLKSDIMNEGIDILLSYLHGIGFRRIFMRSTDDLHSKLGGVTTIDISNEIERIQSPIVPKSMISSHINACLKK